MSDQSGCSICGELSIAAQLGLGHEPRDHYIYRALTHAGFTSLDELAHSSGDELLQFRHLGPVSADRIVQRLAVLGIRIEPRTRSRRAHERPRSVNGICSVCRHLPIATVLNLGHEHRFHQVYRLLHRKGITTGQQLITILRAGQQLVGIGAQRKAILLTWLATQENREKHQP